MELDTVDEVNEMLASLDIMEHYQGLHMSLEDKLAARRTNIQLDSFQSSREEKKKRPSKTFMKGQMFAHHRSAPRPLHQPSPFRG